MAKKRLIDAYDLAETIENMRITVAGKPARWDDAKVSVLREIAQAPDIDAEEVTHCEKCKHYISREERCTEGQPEGYGYCREQNDYFKPDFYCGYGEPKDSTI